MWGNARARRPIASRRRAVALSEPARTRAHQRRRIVTRDTRRSQAARKRLYTFSP